MIPPDFQLESIQNAIWMCEVHGALIDKSNGSDYPPRLLFKWRDQAESNAAASQSSGFEHAPSIDFVTVEKSTNSNGHFEFAQIQIELFNFTVLSSRENYALSMICTSIAQALESPEEAMETLGGRSLTFQVGFSDPHRAPIRVSFDSQSVRFWDDGRPVSSIEGSYEATLVNRRSLVKGITPTAKSTRYGNREGTGTQREPLIPKDSLLTEKLAERLKDEDNVMIEDIRLVAGQWLIRSRAHKPGQYFAIRSLSSSEQMSIHLDLTLAALRIRARRNPDLPFLLILDNVLWCYDERHLDHFVSICERLPNNVQVLVTDSSGRVANHLPYFTQSLVTEKRTGSAGFFITEHSPPPADG